MNIMAKIKILLRIIIFIHICILCSCSLFSPKDYDDIEPLYPPELCIFPVDTIKIENPFVIEYENLRYLVDTPIDSIPVKNIRKFLDHTPHFIYEPTGFLGYLPRIRQIWEYGDPDPCYDCHNFYYVLRRKDYNIASFRKAPKNFVVYAMNIAYFDKMCNSIDGYFHIKSSSPQSRFILLAYGVCDPCPNNSDSPADQK